MAIGIFLGVLILVSLFLFMKLMVSFHNKLKKINNEIRFIQMIWGNIVNFFSDNEKQ